MRNTRTHQIEVSFIGTQRLKKYIVSMCKKQWSCYHVTEKLNDKGGLIIECWLKHSITGQIVTVEVGSDGKQYLIPKYQPRQLASHIKDGSVLKYTWQRVKFLSGKEEDAELARLAKLREGQQRFRVAVNEL